MAIRNFLRRLRPTLRKGAALVLMACVSGPSLLAIPARPGLIQLSQPDGSTVEARMYGDEYRPFFRTTTAHIPFPTPTPSFTSEP